MHINEEGLSVLLNNYMYWMFVVHGRDISFEKTCRILLDDSIIVDIQQVLNAYDFTCDLYDDNEANGNNDDMHPNRKKNA